MVVAAGLLVLVGLGLFGGGILTGSTAFYWGCVAACAVAAVLLFLARRKLTAGTADGEAPAPAVPAGATSASAVAAHPTEEPGNPPVEETEVTDLLLVVDLDDEVLVVDEHPRYHLPGCRHLAGRETIPIPLGEARTDGFTPCAVCAPDRNLARRARERRATPEA